jgi:hypothetical protein
MAARDDAIEATEALQACAWDASLLGSVPAWDSRIGRSNSSEQLRDRQVQAQASQDVIGASPDTTIVATEVVDKAKLYLDALYEPLAP